MMETAQRVSTTLSDNFVFQRSLLAYYEACHHIVPGMVLEIGTGTGYGVDVIASSCREFITVDKKEPRQLSSRENVSFRKMTVPPLSFTDSSFDSVVSFQVIEHIRDDVKMVDEVYRVLRPGGRFVLTTPNANSSLTRNPWHVREYSAETLKLLLKSRFDNVSIFGVTGNEKVMAYYEKNRKAVERFRRFDPMDLEHRLPSWMLRVPYDIMNRINRRRLLQNNTALTSSIKMSDYRVEEYHEGTLYFDLMAVAVK
ncbi:MAG: methyltransferase domain-containing protein [Alistipes sp.]|nr:methyltransferase domain-containing protein [Candidatus Alistipes equi]